MAPAACVDQGRYATPHFIANDANIRKRPPVGIRQRPVVALQPWHVRALVATAHRDEQRSLLGQCLRQPLRRLPQDIDPGFPHRLDDQRVDAVSGLRARRICARFRRISERVEERCRHLRSPRVVDAGEHDGDHGLQQSVPQQGCGAGFVARTNALANRPSAMS